MEHLQFHCLKDPLKRKREEDDSNPASKKMRGENQIGKGELDNDQVEKENDNSCSSTTAFEDTLKKIEMKPRKDQKQDMSHFLRGKTKPILNHLLNELVKKRGIKWFTDVKVRFVKAKPDGEDLVAEPHFRSLCMKTVNQHELHNHEKKLSKELRSLLSYFKRKEVAGY